GFLPLAAFGLRPGVLPVRHGLPRGLGLANVLPGRLALLLRSHAPPPVPTSHQRTKTVPPLGGGTTDAGPAAAAAPVLVGQDLRQSSRGFSCKARATERPIHSLWHPICNQLFCRPPCRKNRPADQLEADCSAWSSGPGSTAEKESAGEGDTSGLYRS